MTVISTFAYTPTIVITGTPGAGKSTAAADLSMRLSQQSPAHPAYFIETGFWYRILGWMHCTGQLYWDGKINWPMLRSLDFRALLLNPDIRRWIQAPEVDMPTALLAQNADIRGLVATAQQSVLARPTSKVLVGADMQGDIKFHLQASPEVAARRRLQLQHSLGNGANLRDLERLVATRAEQDHTRSIAAVRMDNGVISIHTDDLSADRVVDAMMAEIVAFNCARTFTVCNNTLILDAPIL